MKLNCNFLEGGGCKTKNLLWGEYGYFLELHNLWEVKEPTHCVLPKGVVPGVVV